MKREISAGIIIYRKTKDGPKFLLLYHGHNYWNFPKGQIEKEEKSLQAALREVQEEAGFKRSDLKIIPNFKVYEKFFIFRGRERIFKIVIFYLAETLKDQVKISWEHQGYGWFSFRDGLRILSAHKDIQDLLKRVYGFLGKNQK